MSEQIPELPRNGYQATQVFTLRFQLFLLHNQLCFYPIQNDILTIMMQEFIINIEFRLGIKCCRRFIQNQKLCGFFVQCSCKRQFLPLSVGKLGTVFKYRTDTGIEPFGKVLDEFQNPNLFTGLFYPFFIIY